MSQRIPLGPFVLDRLVGVGGAGEVWHGVHQREQVSVAVKVITAARARQDRYREAFQNEVRAVAGLTHDGVVTVLEYGQVDSGAEQASLGRIVAGSPYLAMEFAEKGSLRTAPLPRSWRELRDTLLWLLDTLAHAHANGVIHRDLKPGNVLVFEAPSLPDDPTGASRLRLTDFGLAHATDRAERVIKGTSGTPIFMSPEQFRGQWRDFGPPTDLYALGCMAWTLTCGIPPFRGRGISALMQAHLSEDPPTLAPRIPVPPGFDLWVDRLMKKRPLQRFQRAADAVWALLRLGDAPGEPARGRVEPMKTSMTLPSGTLSRTWPDWEAAYRRTGTVKIDPAWDDEGHPRLIPPLPTSWRRPSSAKPDMRLVGAGLGLYGLRTVPLVGRAGPRDAIWNALKEVREHRTTRVVALRGAAGTGKSRLAEWMAQRADEVGNAVVVRAVHSRGGGPADGISRMVASAIGAVGLPRPELARRVETWLRARGIDDDYEQRALTELIWPARTDSSQEEPVKFGSANERYAVVARVLERLSGRRDALGARRPAVVWLDDVQWGRDALDFAAFSLGRTGESDLPMLVLMTVREEALETRPDEQRLLERICEDPRAIDLPLPHLDAAERRELVGELLGLEGDLAEQVEERTGGNPLFAVQLVGDWVQRGVLEVGNQGFVLKKGERAILPDDIHGLWADRVEQVLRGLIPDARAALELAALLGTQVDQAEWRGACRIARLEVPSELLSRLASRRLAHDTEQGWAFTHGMLRESLERSAKDGGRARELHDACATTLRIRYDVAQHPGIAARLGRHLYLAGRREESLEPLQRGALELRSMSDYPGTMDLVLLSMRILRELEVPASDPRWGEVGVLRAEILITQGRLAEATEVVLECVAQGKEHGWDQVLGQAYRLAGAATAKQGRLAEAEDWARQGEEQASAQRDELERARAVHFQADVARIRGRLDEAIALGRRALARYAVLEEVRGQADVMNSIGAAWIGKGDLDRAEEHIRQAIELYRLVGVRYGEASSLNTLGDLLRRRGQLMEAERHYRLCEDGMRALGSPEYLIARLNRGQVQLELGNYREGRELLEPVVVAMEKAGRRAMEGAAHALLMPCVAKLRDWEAWGEHAWRAIELLEDSGFVDADIARAVEVAADEAEAAGLHHSAQEAYRLAISQWKGTGDTENAARISAKLHTDAELASTDS